MKKYLPILHWLPHYKKAYLAGDISAGITVGIMLIPQGMAYAMIAGLPPVYGLYAAITPQIIYAIFGTSRQLAIGPVAMDSLIVAAGVSVIAEAGSQYYTAMAILLSFMMGTIQFAFGLFNLGFIVNFLSKPVISGFTSAAALIIGINQLQHIVGFDLQRSNNIFSIILEAIQKVEKLNYYALAIGITSIILIRALKFYNRRIPGALIVVILGTLLVYILRLDYNGIFIVKDIPQGLPKFSVPEFSFENINKLGSIAITLALIAFMEAISVAKAIESKHKGEYKLNNNQEMIGLGLGNVIGSFFQAYPTTGGFSRSAVNDQAGANTNLAALISASIIALTLLFLTPLFYYLPKAVLGAIIMVAVFGLVDIQYPKFLWKVKKEDLLMLLGSFIMTLSFGIVQGILAGVIISLAVLVYRTTKPHIAILGVLPGSTDYRNASRFKEIILRDDILVVRHDAQLYFANIDHFIDALNKAIDSKGDALKFIVLHCGSISSIDATALASLKLTFEEIQNKEITIALSGLIGPVRDFLNKSGFMDELGRHHFFMDVHSAVDCYDNCENMETQSNFVQATQSNIFKEREI